MEAQKKAIKKRKTISVVILGTTGMLGSMMYRIFANDPRYTTMGTTRHTSGDTHVRLFNAVSFLHHPTSYRWLKQADYIINCIGITKPFCHENNMDQVTNAITINAIFPHALAAFTQKSTVRLLHITTDCVYSGATGRYDEFALHDAIDVYGKTKSLGEDQSSHVLNICCSIIGPEQRSHQNLFDWYMRQPNKSIIPGYTTHMWNGATTLQLSEFCRDTIANNWFLKFRTFHHTIHFAPNTTVSKYTLLQLLKTTFKKNFKIKSVTKHSIIDRTLQTKCTLLQRLYPIKPMAQAIQELFTYMKEHTMV